ncbi:alpha/beta fold hydrolase [Rhodobacter sp. SY28-1]|uniref:alpha/beta fold hydrolase n=1 Tax=Rhodobacter sp. SY28-1 TaxID=2562317 RepID=UPI0014859F1B|nr:alpha/beta hydrolase [Rhodobacter sp. SY28-1]
MELRTKRILVSPGLALDVVETGNPMGHPVIFLPGLSDSWPSYLPLMAEMRKDRRLIAISPRGHGDSGKPTAPYDLADLARDVISVMRALEVASADIVGHSLGTTVAQKLVELAPSRVTSLVLIGAFVRIGSNPAVIDLHDNAIAKLIDPVDPVFVKEFQESAVGPDTPRETIDRAIAESMKLTARDWQMALGASMVADLALAMIGYRGPVLILHGELDDFCIADEQADLARGSNRRLVSNAHWGHSPHWEHPALVGRLIEQFVSEKQAVGLLPADP